MTKQEELWYFSFSHSAYFSFENEKSSWIFC